MKTPSWILPLFFPILALESCVTPVGSVAAGAGAGGALGAGAGHAVSQGASQGERNRQAAIGAGAGALLGGVAGYIAHGELKERDQRNYEQGMKEGKKSAPAPAQPARPPLLVPAQTEAVWIEDKVRGNTFIPGHYEYRILERARWERQ